MGGLVGLVFFGPAAHYWFKAILRMLPGSDLLSLLAKTALGQVLFGPYITIIFFAAALWCQRELSWAALKRKTAADLLPTLIAGCGYWPIVDFLSFKYVSEAYMPLFPNSASFVWTVFLAFQAARSSSSSSMAD